MIVLGIEDAEGKFHTYGLPETQSFNMMFVRNDILADLGIEIPKTWDELYCRSRKLYFSQSHEEKPNLYLI